VLTSAKYCTVFASAQRPATAASLRSRTVERALSAAGVLCTKLRNQLQDKTLDTLCFLHAHYKGLYNTQIILTAYADAILTVTD